MVGRLDAVAETSLKELLGVIVYYEGSTGLFSQAFEYSQLPCLVCLGILVFVIVISTSVDKRDNEGSL